MVKSATQDVRYSWCFNARDNFSNITTYWSHSTCRCCLCISTSSMFCAYVNCPFHPVQTYGFALLSITRVQIGITSSSSVSCDTGSKNTWREDERRLEKLMKKKNSAQLGPKTASTSTLNKTLVPCWSCCWCWQKASITWEAATTSSWSADPKMRRR